MYLLIIDYTYCVSILAVPFHMRENLIELFKENADNKSSHLQPALKCCDIVDNNYFPIILKENELMLTIKNMSIAKMRDAVTAFVILLCSHHVLNLYSRNLESSVAFFQKCIYSNRCQMTLQYPIKLLVFIKNKKDRTVVI